MVLFHSVHQGVDDKILEQSQSLLKGSDKPCDGNPSRKVPLHGALNRSNRATCEPGRHCGSAANEERHAQVPTLPIKMPLGRTYRAPLAAA